MSSKAITEPQPDTTPTGWRPAETAPSPVREDDPGFVRTVGLVSAGLIIFSGIVLLAARAGHANAFIGTSWASFLLLVGLAGSLFHAALDRDYNYRRLYLGFGGLLLLTGFVLTFLPTPNRVGDQAGPAYLFLTLALLFILAALRNETDPWVRQLGQVVLAGAGGLMAILGMGYGTINGEFLIPLRGEFVAPLGLLLSLLGLVYLTATVASRGTSDERGYRLGLAIGGYGAVVFLVALVRTLIPMFSATASPDSYPFTYGLLLMVVGLLYVVVSVFLCSDSRLVIMTRRELGAFFYSPMAYFVLLGFTIATWLSYFLSTYQLLIFGSEEPILVDFVVALAPVISVLFVVPALTMRLVSEEKRSGTMEVLMTSPVNEVAVVLSKFLAALIMYLVMWAPFGLFLIALRIGGGKDFDYRPLLGFSIALIATGAMFVSMGLFFSCLTRNQVVSGVLTFAGMLALLLIYLVMRFTVVQIREKGDPNGTLQTWVTVLQHLSFINVWVDTLQGRLVFRSLLFPISMTIWWLFLSVKALEARKWT